MHITLVINYSDKRISGGPQGVAYDTVEGLKKNHRRLEKDDIHIHIMSSLGTNFHSTFASDDAYGNLTYEYFKKIIPTAFFSDLNYYLHLKKRKDSIDLLHSHPISGATAGAFLKIPTIFTLHGMYWREKGFDPSMYARFAYGELNVLRFRYVSRRIKKLIAISPYVINEVHEFLKTRVPGTEVIENPVSDLFFEQEKREQEGLILYPASISPLKNQYALIEALYLLKKENVSFHCILPGSLGNGEYVQKLQKLIRTCNLEKEISIPGPAPLDQMLSLYSRASILAVTSLQETAPMIISEAMATGTPVLASHISGIPSMVSEGNSGLLINPLDPVEISDKIRMVLDDDSLRKKFGTESRRIAVSRWKSDIITNKLLDLYMQQATSG
jgi:glycosyltransferase involved in cell wall biosynthesis